MSPTSLSSARPSSCPIFFIDCRHCSPWLSKSSSLDGWLTDWRIYMYRYICIACTPEVSSMHQHLNTITFRFIGIHFSCVYKVYVYLWSHCLCNLLFFFFFCAASDALLLLFCVAVVVAVFFFISFIVQLTLLFFLAIYSRCSWWSRSVAIIILQLFFFAGCLGMNWIERFDIEWNTKHAVIADRDGGHDCKDWLEFILYGVP